MQGSQTFTIANSSILLPYSFLCSPAPPMESNTISRNEHIGPLPLATRFSSSKGYIQDFLNLDQFPLTTSFNLGTKIETNFLDPFDPFCNGSSTDFNLFQLEPDEENSNMTVAMHDFQSGGFLNFPNRKDSFMEIETALDYHEATPLCFIVPDEMSCVTADNPGFFKEHGSECSKKSTQSTNSKQCGSVSTRKCSRGRKKSKSSKGQWTAEEDRLLIYLVEHYGVRKWSNIAQMLKGRIGKQCRERWHNHLRPDIKKDVWTEEEDRILIEVHAQVGNKWAEIAKSLPGRTENTIKNHWNATKRRQFTKRKCRTKWPKPSSLLQNYIKSLNFEKESRSKDMEPPAATDSEIVNNTSTGAPQKFEIGFSPDEHSVPEYDFDEVPEFSFDDDILFKGSSMDLFMNDIPFGSAPGIEDDPCFDIEFPFDMPPLMPCEVVKTELDFFDKNA